MCSPLSLKQGTDTIHLCGLFKPFQLTACSCKPDHEYAWAVNAKAPASRPTLDAADASIMFLPPLDRSQAGSYRDFIIEHHVEVVFQHAR